MSRLFGFDRGTPIDRFYIEDFLSGNASDVSGVCLEVADREYTTRFGGERVAKSDVLHAEPGAECATVVGDLTDLDSVADDTYDCVILTQTLQFIYEIQSAVAEVARILKPGGVCLATVASMSQISRYDMDRWGEYWRLTSRCAERLFSEHFEEVAVTTYGNVLAATAALQGLAAEELAEAELQHHDPDYEMLVCIRARKGDS